MRRILVVMSLLVLGAGPLHAQEQDTSRLPTGVRLGLMYRTAFRPKLAVRPIEADTADGAVAEQVREIVVRDLDFSDRFNMTEPIPERLASGPVDYAPWNDLGVAFLVTGRMEPSDPGYLWRVTLHDVTYARVKEERAYQLPLPTSPEFRMAVHAVSDEIVRWTTGQPGIAATRIAFVRRSGSSYELMLVDSDGENIRRVAASERLLFSPAWSPDGRRLAYAVETADGWRIEERELGGGTRTLVSRPGVAMTPTYSPDGSRLAFAVSTGRSTTIYETDIVRDCCLRSLITGPGENISPTYSPDGRKIAYNSDRLGQPHIYMASSDGGTGTLLSPFTYGEPGYYTSPDWSPTGSAVTFHGRSRGRFQIMVADADRPGAPVLQLTAEGENEDPSWAPDGRHIVFSRVRAGGLGLYVIDTVTGRIRPVIVGAAMYTPDWSPALMRASALAVVGQP